MAGFWINPNGNNENGGSGELPEIITWSMIQDKPKEFTPIKHKHNMEDITNLDATIEELNNILQAKVTKEMGKGLSEENFTLALKEKLVALNPNDKGVISVNGKEGIHIEITKEDLGLGNVLNIKQVSQKEFDLLQEKVVALEGKEESVTSVNGQKGDIIIDKTSLNLDKVLNVTQASKQEFNTHIQNQNIHTTQAEKTSWSNKETPEGAQTKVDLAKKEINDNLNIQLEKKVNKVSGKGLSTNDFTNEYKNTVDTLVNDSDNKVISVNGRQGVVTLTKTDLQLGNVKNIEQASKQEFEDFKEANAINLEKKVNKVEGKVLSSNDFTDMYKNWLIATHTQFSTHSKDTRIHVDESEKMHILSIPSLRTQVQSNEKAIGVNSSSVEALDNEINRILELLGEGGEVSETGVLEVIKKGHLYKLGNEIFDIVNKNKVKGTLARAFVLDNFPLFETNNFMYNTIEINAVGQLASIFPSDTEGTGFKGVFKNVLNLSKMTINDQLVINGELVNEYQNEAKWTGNTFRLSISANDFQDLSSNVVLGKEASVDLSLDANIDAPNFNPSILSTGYNITNNTFTFEELRSHTIKFQTHLSYQQDAIDIKKFAIYVDLDNNHITINRKGLSSDPESVIFQYIVKNATFLKDLWDGSMYIGIEPTIKDNIVCNELLRRTGEILPYDPNRQVQTMRPVLNNATMIHTLNMEMDLRPNVKFGTNELEQIIQAKVAPTNEIALRNIVVLDKDDPIEDIPIGTIVFYREQGE